MSDNQSKKPHNPQDSVTGSVDISNDQSGELNKNTTDDPVENVGLSLVNQQFRGPIPPPVLLKQYEEVLPGSADRIVRMAEQEQESRYKVQNRVVSNQRIRILSGLAVSFALVVGAVISAYFGQSAVAIVLGGAGVVGAIAQDLLRRLIKRNEDS